jgi:hypothetical protein
MAGIIKSHLNYVVLDRFAGLVMAESGEKNTSADNFTPQK